MPREDTTDRGHVIAALAGVAMHAIVSGPVMGRMLEGDLGKPSELEARIARTAVDQAEALLAEIERRQGGPL